MITAGLVLIVHCFVIVFAFDFFFLLDENMSDHLDVLMYAAHCFPT